MKMKLLLLFLTFIAFSVQSNAQRPSNRFVVMAWNILHGGNDIATGKINVIKIIKAINPDVVLMVETYGSGKMIADSLQYNFHLVAQEGTDLNDKAVNLSILSKFPIQKRIDTKFPFFLGGSEMVINNQKIRFLSTWFHYLPWEDEPEKISVSVEEILRWEKNGSRLQMIDSIMPYLQRYSAQTDSIPLILGGDLNTPSHLDWNKQTRKLHAGLVVPWQSTKCLENLGLIDTYRNIHPNPIQFPGITWDSKEKKDEHRIDYIFYKGSKIKVTKSESYRAFFNDPFSINGTKVVYPSDHGFVVTTFEIK